MRSQLQGQLPSGAPDHKQVQLCLNDQRKPHLFQICLLTPILWVRNALGAGRGQGQVLGVKSGEISHVLRLSDQRTVTWSPSRKLRFPVDKGQGTSVLFCFVLFLKQRKGEHHCFVFLDYCYIQFCWKYAGNRFDWKYFHSWISFCLFVFEMCF